ncbi:hypothetical protein [Sphingopyxis flava]|uniref:Uncharacterized protein n=1 Tax=Sphingopyxis flava TaxID=1507287 RepID=A0A1T5CTK6_9SPHN|nr:hypothetical protein [Sphingopyxis flava]SKB62676.1 hypothetical protein SAMN06295937_101196 [Sphingopyxis flava]
MTDKINWGPAIPTPNGRPSWLLDTETVVDLQTASGWRCSERGAGNPAYNWCWHVIKAIRLPEGHAYYLATDKGFTYWPGGESAPEDYDGGEILYRDGTVFDDAADRSWEHAPTRSRFYPEYDIIGYRPADQKYGDRIIVNGVAPDWLREDDIGLFENTPDDWLGENGKTLLWWVWGGKGDCPISIRLPKDHPYYTVQRYNQEHGTDFVYWPGGDNAPADWDGKEVIFRDRTLWKTPSPYAIWDHRGNCAGDIIGYRRAVAPETPTRRVKYTGIWSPDRRGKTGTVTGDPTALHGGVWDDGEIWIGYLETNLTDLEEEDPDTVEIKRMTESEARAFYVRNGSPFQSAETNLVLVLKELGLIKPEPTVEVRA